jgi:hypothetical protein
MTIGMTMTFEEIRAIFKRGIESAYEKRSDPEVDEAVLRVLQDVVGLMLNKLADCEKEAAKRDADV